MGFVNGPRARKSASAKTCSQTCVCIPKQIHNPKSRTTFHLIYHASPAANTPHAPNAPPPPPPKKVWPNVRSTKIHYMQKGLQLVRHFLCVCARRFAYHGHVCWCRKFSPFHESSIRVCAFRLVREKVKTTPQPTLTPFACQLHLAMLSGGCCVCVCFVHEHAREWQ